MLQIKNLLNNGLTAFDNPYGYVFLNQSHKKQVQLSNVEFFRKRIDNRELTRKWTFDYVYDTIKKSEISKLINLDMKKKNVEFDYIVEELQESIKKLDYCGIHKEYYNSKKMFCPECLKLFESRNIEILEIPKNHITSLELETSGGESEIYSYDSKHVAKVFKDDVVDIAFKKEMLIRICMKSKELQKINHENPNIEYVLPEKILISDNSIYGYIMKRIEGLPVSRLKYKENLSKYELTRKDVFEILIDMGEGIELLHRNNMFIGDLNDKNIFFDKEKKIYFLDLDGMGIDDISPCFFTDGYIDPDSRDKQHITEKDDWYSFAIQVFYFLTYVHPFNGIYKENGKVLNIIEKMEKRISLLGNHGIVVPEIAEKWDWMNDSLKKFLLNTFEENLRENITPHLITQYQELYNGTFEINSRFIAKKIYPFGNDVVYVINQNVAICEQNNKKYAIVVTDSNRYVLNSIYGLDTPREIKNIMISKDEKFAFEVIDKKLFVIDLKEDICLHSIVLTDDNNVRVGRNSVYYIEEYQQRHVITKESFGNESEKKSSIELTDEQPIKAFNVEFDNKFVVVQKFTDDCDMIYCNGQGLCTIDCNNVGTNYNIVYNKDTDKWLVINEEKHIVIINPDGSYSKLRLDMDIQINVNCVSFYKNKLYIPGSDVLWILKIKKEHELKKMECHEIMRPNSIVCDSNSSGFNVITNGVLYEVSKA